MNEYLMIYIMAMSGALFSLGGTKGKYWRRYVLPLAIGLPMGYYAPWWAVLGYVLALSAFLHLGYGDRASWWYRFIIFSGYFLPCLFFGFSGWIILSPLLCCLIFLLSNTKISANMFFWKGCEFGFGLLIAITLIATINGGFIWK